MGGRAGGLTWGDTWAELVDEGWPRPKTLPFTAPAKQSTFQESLTPLP